VTLRFGTDGVRGVANSELTPELVSALGRAAAEVLESERFVLGRDTRRSGPLLESALASGLAAEGVTVELLGVVPTPAVAHVAATDGIAGAMISASHNPYGDNGVKLFAPGGRKLTDALEERLEAELDRLTADRPAPTAAGPQVGTIDPRPDEAADWAAAVGRSIGATRLDGLHVVADCAHGSASSWAGPVLERLGADVTVINAEPDGMNINDGCGSTHPEGLGRTVIERGADLGLAFDGDADRVLAVDQAGRLIDGDFIIAVCARDRHDRGALEGDAVVVTVMANLGFRLAMEAADITVVETAVGDRYVLQALGTGGYSLGGEQSGHVIFPDLASTGDGLLTAVQLLDVVARSGRSLGELADEAMTKLPQVLHNVPVQTRMPDVADRLADEIAAAEATLGERGRVLVRPSGTEPLVRVMVEADDEARAETVATELATAAATVAGGR
jgi:phosphoglucosamine mutase